MHHCTNANAEVSSGRFFAGPRGVSIAAFGNMGPLSSTEQKGKDCHDQDKQATRGTRLYHGAQSPLRVRSDVLFQLPNKGDPNSVSNHINFSAKNEPELYICFTLGNVARSRRTCNVIGKQLIFSDKQTLRTLHNRSIQKRTQPLLLQHPTVLRTLRQTIS